MELKKKYLRGTARYVANELGITYSAARVKLLNDNTQAKQIALDFEQKILLKEQAELEILKKKELNVQKLKKNLNKVV